MDDIRRKGKPIRIPELDEAARRNTLRNWLDMTIPGEEYTARDVVHAYYIKEDAPCPTYIDTAKYLSRTLNRRITNSQISAYVSKVRRSIIEGGYVR